MEDKKQLLEDFMFWLTANWEEFRNKFRRFISEDFPGLKNKIEIIKKGEKESSEDELEIEEEDYGDMPKQLRKAIIKDKKKKLQTEVKQEVKQKEQTKKCEICDKEVNNPQSAGHIRSKVHQEALKKIEKKSEENTSE